MSRRVVLVAALALLAVAVILVLVRLAGTGTPRDALVWGGDQEGGGPYIYPQDDDPAQVTGFEVDLMNLLGDGIGLPAHFVQCEWTNLPDLLRIGGIDVIANGYELTEGHQRTKIATIPYYVYQLRLVVPKQGAAVRSWEDLKRGERRWRVGVLSGSAAELYVREHFGNRVEVVSYQGTTDVLTEVTNAKLDATVQDNPPLVFYKNRYPKLEVVDEPAGRGYYVLYLRPGEEKLRDTLDEAIRSKIASGELRTLYERYGLWNDAQEALGKPETGAGIRQAAQVRGLRVVWDNLPLLLESAGLTVLLSCTAMPLAIVLGLAVAVGRLYGPAPLRLLLSIYVEVLRGTPLMLQLFVLFFVLPDLGIRIPALYAAILGLGINYSAYEAEIYRAGLRAVPIGQFEGALALGLSRWQALRHVIIPQAVRMVIPPVTNDFVALFKDTSICSVITLVELTKRYNILANSTGAYLELATVTALLYLLMSYPLSLLARRLEAAPQRQLV